MNALTGKGLQVDKQSSRRSVNVHVPKANKGGLIMPQNWRSPPFYGNWPQTSGMGLKKKKSRKTKKGEGLLLGKNSPFKKIPLLNILL